MSEPASIPPCIFCGIEKERIIGENEFALLFFDRFPVTEGHSLIIPKRHVKDYFELTDEEISAVNELISAQKKRLTEEDNTITGFNIGTNAGISAGQTVMHCHIHLIPRRDGDTPDPRGGVRGVIPDKMKY